VSETDAGKFFSADLHLVPPGLVDAAAWRTGRPSRRTRCYVGAGRKLAGGE
jgi:hypothetical protein